MGAMTDWREQYLADIRREFTNQRGLAERAVEQLDDGDMLRAAGDDDNSVAVLMKHVGGNLRSRWTEPFTTDGEKSDRNRDGEFDVVAAVSDSAAVVAEVRRTWERGWAALDGTLAALEPDDLDREVTIRGEVLALVTALHRSLAHTAQHVGQIIMLAKQWRAAEWRTLSIPKGESQTYVAVPPSQGTEATIRRDPRP